MLSDAERSDTKATANKLDERPNVVFMLIDDLGWTNTSLYGSDYYETPNVDRLGAEGTTFTDAYAASPLCSPTRASIMTGQHPARIGITAPACHVEAERLEDGVPDSGPPDQKVLSNNSATRLSLEHRTLAETLGEAGYATGHFGKWHLGREPYDALSQGFDVDIPHTSASGPVGGYHAPWSFWPDHGEVDEARSYRDSQNIEDAMAAEAAAFIEDHADDDEPFFCNYWSFSVHLPLDGDLPLVEKYMRKPADDDSRHHPVYGAMVEKMDQALGTLLDTLEEQGVREETVVMFSADHGGMNWPAPAGGRRQITSNAPLRGGKASIYEGGTRVPLVVSWPGKVDAGTETDAMVSSVDYYPTLLDLLDLDAPANQHFDGSSFEPVLADEEGGRDELFCHFPHDVDVCPDESPAAYVRSGDWKLIRFFHDGPELDHRYELYNLADDLGEVQNLAHAYPEKVADLDDRLEDFLVETDATQPKPNPDYDPEAAGETAD